MRIIETKIYTIEEHPDKEKCFDWIRNNWYDLNEHSVDEIIEGIKSLSNKIGGSFDYAISQNPDRNEHITFYGYDHEELCKLNAEERPLTGRFWDIDIITGLIEGNPNKVLSSLHSDTEYQYSNKGLLELCEANQYEFDRYGNCI